MKILINITALVLITHLVVAQNSIDSVLSVIERNNTSLMAARKSADAEKTANRTGLFLPNPEVEFAFLKANESQPVNRTDFSISQSFDFPTAYSYRNSISKLKNEQVDINYERERRTVLLRARLICSELVYRNALHVELQRRLNHAMRLASAYEKMLDAGEANIIEYNRAQLNLATVNNQMEINAAERATLLNELALLNGGNAVQFADSVFQPVALEMEFDDWFKSLNSNYTNIQWLALETSISAKEQKLNTATSLPRLSAGYMSENVPGEKFRGVTAGISIPLWENRNTVKYAKARTNALTSLQEDQTLQLKSNLFALYDRTSKLQSAVSSYRQRMNEFNNELLLTKALDSGHISLSEYFIALSEYYDAVDRLFEMEKELDMAYTELKQVK